MGNEYSSPRRDDDGDTIMSGTSEWTYDRDKMKRSVNRSKKDNFGPANFIDAICGGMIFEDDVDESPNKRSSSKRSSSSKKKKGRDRDHDDDDYSDDDTYNSERPKSRKDKLKNSMSLESEDYSYDEKAVSPRDSLQKEDSLELESPKNVNIPSFDSQPSTSGNSPTMHAKPLASAFAKRCYFTKAGIGPLAQHYEGVTLTGNSVLMLASAMKLKGCPTICDEDLRRVEQTFPNQFSRLPDELLLSSGWRRVSKYCHFSGKAIPDGMPFFHSKERLHPQTSGYYFLVASSIGMERPSEVEPLSIDMLILLQTDFPDLCDQAPKQLLEDPNEWTLVTKFCFFSGGPINAEEDVYYEADFDGNTIHMLAFLSPNLTPEELYRLNDITGESALKSVAAVEEVDKVYNLTERDFEDLKLYHLGPCRALPSYLLAPESWRKVLPNSFIECREKALARAFEYESHAQEAIAAAGKLIGNGNINQNSRNENGYIEFHKGQEAPYSNSHDEIQEEKHQPIVENEIIQQDDQYNGQQTPPRPTRSPSPRRSSRGNTRSISPRHVSPQRVRGKSRSITPRRVLQEDEEFPDPEPVLAIGEMSDEFPNIDDDINIGPIEPPVERRNVDSFEAEDIKNRNNIDNDDQPMDEARAHQEQREMAKNSHYLSIGVGSKTPDDVDDEVDFETRERDPNDTSISALTNELGRRSVSPKRNAETKPLEIDTHVDEVIDVPDPSPKDIISPMSASSPIEKSSTPSFAPTPSTIGSAKSQSQNSYTRSSAMRGAQQLLKKNRQQRLAIMAKRRNSSATLENGSTSNCTTPNSDNENNAPGSKSTRTVYSRSRNRSVTPRRVVSPPKKKALSPNNASAPAPEPEPSSPTRSHGKMSIYKPIPGKATFNLDKPKNTPSDATEENEDMRSEANSAISGTSSVWTDATDSKDSRRALILKMAKNRMKKKKSDNSSSTPSSNADN